MPFAMSPWIFVVSVGFLGLVAVAWVFLVLVTMFGE
jgi:hypothetical protein